MEISGFMRILSPLICDLKVTPLWSILASVRESIWKPPESVKVGPRQLVNSARPPAFSIRFGPGARIR